MGFDDSELSVLVEATTNLPELRAVIERAEMYSLVEALMDGTCSRKRLDVLDGMRASVCNSIDGY